LVVEEKESPLGSGTTIQEVNKLLKQFDETRKIMRMITTNKNALKNFAKR
jgi:signal recognition particle subunit FFH/SRP54 (srp54)